MNPIIYEYDETQFADNGIGRLPDCLTCEVTEERNGIYECDLTYPVDGSNYDIIKPGRMVYVDHDETGDMQPFDITAASYPINGVVSFHAVHVSYRLAAMTVYGTAINSLAAAFARLKSAAVPASNFVYTPGFTATGFCAAFDGTPRTVRQILGGVEGSILDTYGGEYKFDRWTVSLLKQRGTKRDLVIRYGLNLADYVDDINYVDTYNAVYPYWSGSNTDGTPQVIIGNKVTSGRKTFDGRERCVPLDLTDKFESKPTKAQLQTAAQNMFRQSYPENPSQTISVNFVRLQDYPDYAAFAPLLECSLCDTVRVVFPRYGMDGEYKIVRTVWDAMAGRYKEMELGNLPVSLAEALGVSK